MLIVLSPAKKIDFDLTRLPANAASAKTLLTQPEFLDLSEKLVNQLREFSVSELQTLMSISEPLATLNKNRFESWQRPFNEKNAGVCLLMFQGDVYQGLKAATLNQAQLAYGQSHLRILSGLYGILKPLDFMQPYRLEMGTALANDAGRNLYDFWQDTITVSLNETLEKQPEDTRVLINLASNEYFKAINLKQLQGKVITPVFKDLKNDQYKMISFFAKKARGMMARFIIDHELQACEKIKRFNYGGYLYNHDLSQQDEWVFTRDKAD